MIQDLSRTIKAKRYLLILKAHVPNFNDEEASHPLSEELAEVETDVSAVYIVASGSKPTSKEPWCSRYSGLSLHLHLYFYLHSFRIVLRRFWRINLHT